MGLARSFFSNRGFRGGGFFSIHTLIMSQLADISETITVGGYFVSKSFPGKLRLERVLARPARVCRRFHKRSSTRSTFNQIRSL